jgi:hypothetical protein
MRVDGRALVKAVIVVLPALLAWGYYATIIHEMGFAYRFSYPTYILIVLALAAVSGVVVRALRSRPLLGLAAVCGTTAVLAGLLIRGGDWQPRSYGQTQTHAYHSSIGAALADTRLGSSATVITSAAGVIPYRSGFNHIDPVGLTDNFLSGRRSISAEQYEQYLWSRDADVYIGWEPPASVGAASAADEPRMRTWYVAEHLLSPERYPLQWNHPRFAPMTTERRRDLLHSRMRELRDHWVWIGQIDSAVLRDALRLKSMVYVRADSPHVDALVAALQGIVSIPPDGVRLDQL